jgi:hypothetical protein
MRGISLIFTIMIISVALSNKLALNGDDRVQIDVYIESLCPDC